MALGFWIGLILYVIFLGVYWFFVLSIIWHVKEYSMPQDHSKWTIRMFLMVIFALNLAAALLFFRLPF